MYNQIITQPAVFLSGPMRGVPRELSRSWRLEAARLLSKQFTIIDSFRGREEKEAFPDPRGAIIRDKNDIKKSSVILVNDSFADASMIGTAMEMMYAFELDKPIILFGNAHPQDYWLNYHCHTRCTDLEHACKLLSDLFSE